MFFIRNFGTQSSENPEAEERRRSWKRTNDTESLPERWKQASGGSRAWHSKALVRVVSRRVAGASRAKDVRCVKLKLPEAGREQLVEPVLTQGSTSEADLWIEATKEDGGY